MPEEFFNSQDSTNQSDNTNSQFSVDANTISVDTNDTPHADSYSSEELADPNKIVVTIADKDTPIVLLIGPPASGKTMTLVRLARYLRTQPVTRLDQTPHFVRRMTKIMSGCVNNLMP